MLNIMKIAMFPGSFKPPHSGHLKVIETIMKKYKPDRFHIIVSNKPRLLEEPYEKKLGQLSELELEKIAKKYKIKNVSKKSIENAAVKKIVPAISPVVSIELWKKYLALLPEKMREKVKISISNQPSPIMFAFVIIKSKVKKGDKLLLLKSEKDVDNKRFSIFDNLDAKKEEILIPTFKEFNSWQMRKAIAEKDWKKVEEFFPDGIDKKELLNIIKNNIT